MAMTQGRNTGLLFKRKILFKSKIPIVLCFRTVENVLGMAHSPFDIPSCPTLVSHEPSCCRLLVFLHLSFVPSCLLSWAAPRQAGIAREIYCVCFVYNLIRSLFMPLTWHFHKKSLIKCPPRMQINTCLNCTVTFRLELSARTSSGCVHLCFMALETHGVCSWGFLQSGSASFGLTEAPAAPSMGVSAHLGWGIPHLLPFWHTAPASKQDFRKELRL